MEYTRKADSLNQIQTVLFPPDPDLYWLQKEIIVIKGTLGLNLYGKRQNFGLDILKKIHTY